MDGCYVVEQEPIKDERGFFARVYCSKEFEVAGLNTKWVQVNNSLSEGSYTLRGLHYQREPYEEVKLIRCISGCLWDVVVDIRKDSPTYKSWFGTMLSEENRSMMYCPRGCAHGFLTLTNNTEALYLVSAEYSREHEGSLLWSDRTINIKWPYEPIVVSRKDEMAPTLDDLMKLKVTLR